MKKYFISTIILMLSLSGCTANATQETIIHREVIESPSSPNQITVRGTVESVESRNVYSTLGFTVEEINVTEGDTVRAGDVLATLTTTDLEFALLSLKATLESTRQTTENAVTETRRMLTEAETNLANNTNVHILTAEAALNAATTALEIAEQNYNNAISDQEVGNSPHVLAAEIALRTLTTELETMETTFNNTQQLYSAGVVTRDNLRTAENALTQLQNQHNDAQTAFENATAQQYRTINQLRTAMQSARTARTNASELLTATRAAARQEVETLRATLTTAEIAANTETLEISIQQMEQQLSDSIITAPINGTITAVIAREGAIAMGPLFVVEDTDNLRIITSFREYDIAMVETGMEVTITPDATGSAEYVGIINRINPAATPNLPVVMFEAQVLVTSPDPGLLIGMNVRLDVR